MKPNYVLRDYNEYNPYSGKLRNKVLETTSISQDNINILIQQEIANLRISHLMNDSKTKFNKESVEKAVKESKAGKVEYRVDKQSIVHIGLGKVSFGADKLFENANTFFDSLKSQKPASLKGTYVKSVYITTTMGPSIAVENLYN